MVIKGWRYVNAPVVVGEKFYIKRRKKIFEKVKSIMDFFPSYAKKKQSDFATAQRGGEKQAKIDLNLKSLKKTVPCQLLAVGKTNFTL